MDFQKMCSGPQGEEETAATTSSNINPQQTSTQVVQQQPLPQSLIPKCNVCGITEKLLRCAKCKVIHYCSIDHQHLDWPTHRQQCRELAKLRQHNTPVQQLTSSCDDININVHPNANILSNSGECSLNCNLPPAYDSNQPDRNKFVLGTHENEILSSKAETVTQNTNSNVYVGSFDANSTTTNQMHLMVQNNLDSSYLGIDVKKLLNDNSYYYQVHQQQQLEEQNRSNTELSSAYVSQTATTFQPRTQTMVQPQVSPQRRQLNIPLQQSPQQLLNANLQYPVPQLSSPTINRQEKRSSYQMNTAGVDDNNHIYANERRYEDLCRNIIRDMNHYGLSVVDDFLGPDRGVQVLNEVHEMYSSGIFRDGQLVNKVKSEQQLHTIRGDKITWVKGLEPGCSNIGYLITQIDALVCRANNTKNNGKLGDYTIKERTKAMVACYPGSGSQYVMHVDNPNKDGRVITAIYYLNRNWDSKNNGGVLRIFPEQTSSVADIEPKFDRLIFFWSDKRNPHEVQPAHKTRYAITVWYFDAHEREQALNRVKRLQNAENANTSASNSPSSSRSNTENKPSNIVNPADTNASGNTPPHYSRTSSTISSPSSSPSNSLTSSTNVSPTKRVQVVRPTSQQ